MTISIGVLFSGGGRTILNLLDCIDRGELDATISIAIASREGLAGTDRLIERNIDVAIAKVDGMSLEESDARTIAWLEETKPDLVCLCGYLRLLEIKPWMQGRVINIHPSLLPAHGGKGMYGMRVHRAVLESGDLTSGCTVHHVDGEYDHGPTILQRSCEIQKNDSPQDLADRVFDLECEAYPEAIRQLVATLQP
ncbi:MAG: phosphoribosylglycinamide formyltransferase [Planctomycetes bacterium]|nr:phosphoribosylglycinamide formyltransferase [Planctomycetota bacterium]